MERAGFARRSLWTGQGLPGLRRGICPGNDRLGDEMTGILGYARVSTGDQDVAGQTMRLTQAGAIKVFTDVRSGRSMDRPGLQKLLAYARHGGRRRSCVWTVLGDHSVTYWPL